MRVNVYAEEMTDRSSAKAIEELDRHYESRELKIGHRVEPTKPIEYESKTIPVGTIGYVQDIRGGKVTVAWNDYFGVVGWCDLDCVRRI